MAYTTLNLTPAAIHYQTYWDDDSWYEADIGEQISLGRRIWLQMPGVYISPEDVTSVALNVAMTLEEGQEAGNRTLYFGYSNELGRLEEDSTECTTYVDNAVTEMAFLEIPNVDITSDWYIYICCENNPPLVSFDSVTLTHFVAATACGAPEVCYLSETLTIKEATLSWDGATAGIGNAVSGYEVQRAESADGIEWGEWETLTVTTASSIAVYPPEIAGDYYMYRVRTLGSEGDELHSAWTECEETLRRDHIEIEPFTDEVLVPGETPIKALHMLELQDRVAMLRSFYNLSEYRFTAITAGETSLAGWMDHVLEIREAIDEMTQSHDAWLMITENKPRADVMMQLRDVILNM